MRYIAVDTETKLIRPGLAAPRLVCLSSCARGVDGALALGLYNWREALVLARQWLCDRAITLVFHNGAYDLTVLAARDPSLMPLIFRALAQGRIADTQIREQLIMIARGDMGFQKIRKGAFEDADVTEAPEESESGDGADDDDDTGESAGWKRIKKKYTLDALTKHYLDRALDKADDGWRLRYGELIDTPVSAWPERAREYAMEDAAATLEVFEVQSPNRDLAKYVSPDERMQCGAAFALHLAAVWGLRTDPDAIDRLETRLEAIQKGLESKLLFAGLMRQKSKRDPTLSRHMAAIRTMIAAAYKARGEPVPLTKGGIKAQEKGQPVVIEKHVATGKDIVEAVAMFPYPIEPYKLPVENHSWWLAGYADDVTVKTESGKVVHHFPGLTFDGFKTAVASNKFAALEPLGAFANAQKVLKTYVRPMKQGITMAMNSRPNVLVETGRTSWGAANITMPDGSKVKQGCNLQNQPRMPGVRECFIARPGKVLISVDYDSLELRTLAQAMLKIVGSSTLARRYQANPSYDPHSAFAARMLGISYDEGMRLKTVGDKRFKEHRQLAKCFDPDVEFLTRSGWKKFDALADDDEIMQADPSKTGVQLSWCLPTNKFEKQADDLVRLSNESMDIRVTSDHRMLAFNMAGNPVVCLPAELSKKRGWWNAGVLADDKHEPVHIDEAWLRLAVATQADGSYQAGSPCIRFGFSKQRKIDRLRAIVQAAGGRLESERTYTPKNPAHNASLHMCLDAESSNRVRELLTVEKHLPHWWTRLSQAGREAVLDEVRYWDSHSFPGGVSYSYTSVPPQNIEVLQTLAAITNRKSASHALHNPRYADGVARSLTVRTKATTRGENLEVTPVPGTHRVVCLSVDSGFVLVRQNGKVLVCGQCPNFGYPGGMSAKKLVDFAWKTYGIRITVAEATRLKEIWFEENPEARDLFAWVSDKVDAGGKVRLFSSGRVRGNGGYNELCNLVFQGSAADGAKLALFAVAKECYAEPSSPLFGGRVVAFVHDEVIVEIEQSKAHAAALRITEIMIKEMRRVIPDVPIEASPAIMYAWSKAAEAAYNDDGELIPFEDAEKKKAV